MASEQMVAFGFWIFLGLCVGSFLTVAIDRLPQGRGIVWGRSACPACGHVLGVADLVPLLSWASLRGRCRWCGGPIPAFYPLVELLTGLSWGYAYLRFEQTGPAALAALVLAVLIAATMMDLRAGFIPDRLLVIAAGLGAPLALWTGVTTWEASLLGGLACGGFLVLVGLVPRGGMDPGDAKLAAVLGLVLGWQQGLVILLVAFATGGLAGLALIATRSLRGRDRLPFAPFLAVGGVVALFWGRLVFEPLRLYLGF